MRRFFGLAFLLLMAPAFAETVLVKYRGYVDLAPFECRQIRGSSFVHRICFDSQFQYLLVNLKGTYYHYCGIDPQTVSRWIDADSKGRFYNRNIKGRFDCRIGVVPDYPKVR